MGQKAGAAVSHRARTLWLVFKYFWRDHRPLAVGLVCVFPSTVLLFANWWVQSIILYRCAVLLWGLAMGMIVSHGLKIRRRIRDRD